MSHVTEPGLRFGMFFTWGGVSVALLGLVLVAAGSPTVGVAGVVAGVVVWLFAKRRRRRAAG